MHVDAIASARDIRPETNGCHTATQMPPYLWTASNFAWNTSVARWGEVIGSMYPNSRIVDINALRALAPLPRAPVPRPSRPQPRTPQPRWSRRHSSAKAASSLRTTRRINARS